MKPKLAIVATHPIQHFCPLYRELASRSEFDLEVIFASRQGTEPYFDSGFNRVISWERPLLDGFESHFLRTPHQVWSHLNRIAPTAVQVYGYAHPIARHALLWAKLSRRRVLMVTDSELLRPRRVAVRAAKRAILPLLFRAVDRFLTCGDANENYYRNYGVPSERLIRCPFPRDERYYEQLAAHAPQHRAALRAKLGIPPEAAVLLSVGKLTASKSHAHICEAMAKLPADLRRRVRLVLAGDGPERPALQESGAILRGFVNLEELPHYYMAADLYVHPSAIDAHPLAISEAIYFGLPIIASSRVGSVGPTDDAQPGRNACVYEWGDIEGLSRTLAAILRDPASLTRASVESFRISDRRSLRITADALAHAVTGAPPCPTNTSYASFASHR